MKLADALKGLGHLYLETAPIIYYVEENQNYIALMEAVIEAIENTSLKATSSVLTLTEVLVHPLKHGNTQLVQTYQMILTNNSDLRLTPITSSIAKTAADLRARHNLRTPDALHLATAIESASDAFLTNDLALQRVTEITVLVLDNLEL